MFVTFLFILRKQWNAQHFLPLDNSLKELHLCAIAHCGKGRIELNRSFIGLKYSTFYAKYYNT